MRVRPVLLALAATLGCAAPSSAVDVHLFGRIASSEGLGLKSPSLGLKSRVRVTDFIVSGMLVGADKLEGESALFWGGDVEWRRSRRRLVYGASLSFVQQVTSEYRKSGYYPSLRLGYQITDHHTLLLTYRAPDSTENETWGFGLGLELFRGPLGLIADVEQIWYRMPSEGSEEQGVRAAIALGWRF